MTASKIILSFLILMSIGCASTPKQKILRDMVVAGTVGAIVGSQSKNYKEANSLMYAGGFASVAAVSGLFIYDPDKETQKYKKEVEDLKAKLEEAFSPRLESQMPGTLSGKVPVKYKTMISPGEWKIYAIDQWVEDGENRLIHQDKIMELIPPSLRPIQNPLSNKGVKRE